MFTKARVLAVVWMLSMVLTSSSCDKLSSLGDYFAPKQKPSRQPVSISQTKPAAPAQPSPAAQLSQPPPAQPVAAKNVLAKVGSWTLTIEDFKERVAALKEAFPEFDPQDINQQKMVLQELINQELLVQEAEKRGVHQDKNIQRAIEELRRTLLVRELATKLTESVKATEEEAKQYYEEHKNEEGITEPAQWRVREIVVENEEEAKNIAAELYKGANFEELVKAKSIGKSAWRKGDLEFKSTFEFPAMEKAVAALEVGAFSGVFKGPEGYYIVKLEEKQGGEAKKFEELKDDIVQLVTMLKQQQLILEQINRLRQEVPIEVNENLLEEQRK